MIDTLRKFCGGCVYYTGEECDGPSGSHEGREVYSDTNACDCYEEICVSDDVGDAL